MFSRKEIKQRAKKIMKKHFFRSVILVFVSTLLISGGYSYATSSAKKDVDFSNTNQKVVSTVIDSKGHDKTNAEIVEELLQTSKKDINKSKDKIKKRSQGILSVIFNEMTSSKTFLLGILNSINKLFFKGNITLISVVSILIALYILYVIFIKFAVLVGKSRYFIEKHKYSDTKVDKLFYVYKSKKVVHTSLALIVKSIYETLWYFTIIGGIIKNYSYRMVPYILAENPDIKANEAITLSRKMMNGYKWKTFILDISFFWWWILGVLTFNLSNVLYFDVYKESVNTELYMELRENSKKLNILNSNLLNDKLLDGDKVDSIYPESKLETKVNGKKIINGVDYNRKYSLSSIILLFFTFSFVGWIWEVVFHLVSDGVFVNRGTMFGPWLPIYGTGGVLILLLLKPFMKKPWLMFIMTMVLCGIVEYSTAWYLETFKHLKWWDYSGYLLNLDGRICLEGLIVFGLGGCAFSYLIAPAIDNLYKNIKPKLKGYICAILLILFSVDMVYSHVHPNTGKGITNYSYNNIIYKII